MAGRDARPSGSPTADRKPPLTPGPAHRKMAKTWLTGGFQPDELLCGVGVAAGARIVHLLSGLGSVRVAEQSVPAANLLLLSVYSVFLLLLALTLWQQAKGSMEALDFVRRGPITRLRLPLLIDLPSVPLREVSALGIAYIGLLLGLCSGVLGIGGGIILIPILLYGYGFPFRHAAGTGIIVTLLTAIFGTCLHAVEGRVHLGLALTLLMGSAISARVGVMLTRSLSVRNLRRGLTFVVLATALLVLSRLALPFLS